MIFRPAVWRRHASPALLSPAVAFPASFPGGRLRGVGGDGALVDDLHAGTPVVSSPAAGGHTGNQDVHIGYASRHHVLV